MRRFLMVFSALLLGEIMVFAQAPTQPPPPAQPAPIKEDLETEKRLDAILKAWSSRMAGIESFYTKCARTVKDPLTKKETTFEGEAMFSRPNLAKIELINQANKEDFEKIFFKEKFIFQYHPKEKLVMVHEIPPMSPSDDNMVLAFLRGMKPADARNRFKLTLQKENEFYVYILIEPRNPADKQDFTQAQLALWIKTPPTQKTNIDMMPARFWYREPNQRDVTYLFTEMAPNLEIAKERFVPTKPQGWEVKYANQTPIAKNPAPAPKPMK